MEVEVLVLVRGGDAAIVRVDVVMFQWGNESETLKEAYKQWTRNKTPE